MQLALGIFCCIVARTGYESRKKGFSGHHFHQLKKPDIPDIQQDSGDRHVDFLVEKEMQEPLIFYIYLCKS